MPKSTSSTFKASRYNFVIPTETGSLLFNANTGAVSLLSGPDTEWLCHRMTQQSPTLDLRRVPEELLIEFVEGRFIISTAFDELQEVRERYERARVETPVSLTITTTLDCNLGCYYCYEDRSNEQLGVGDISQLIALARSRIAMSKEKRLHVSWYGGEPLLNVDFIEAASLQLQDMCTADGIRYSASVVSNGTLWPSDLEGFVKRHKLRQVQISFDGLRHHHEKRRRYIDPQSRSEQSSFDKAVEVVDKLLECCRVDVRFNIDRGNQSDLLPFYRFAERRGWFAKRFPAVLQPARVSAYTERAGFIRRRELSTVEYDALRGRVKAEFQGRVRIDEAEVPDGFPYPKTSVCAALAVHSAVLGADGRVYRCGLQVSEPARATGTTRVIRFRDIAVVTAEEEVAQRDEHRWWNNFDPTTLPTCSVCSFLPICWGGCPKKHLDGDEHAIAEQGAYWRENLASLVAGRFGLKLLTSHVVSRSEQFRSRS